MSLEFVIILPMLVGCLIAAIEAIEAFRAGSQFDKVSFAINDIMSRHDAVDDVDIQYLAALRDKMLPVRISSTRLRITSICFANEQYRVLWSFADEGEGSKGASSFHPLDDDTIPIGLMPTLKEQKSVILTEIEGEWNSPFGGIVTSQNRLRTALVVNPRFVEVIPHATLNDSNVCPTE
ncbi:MAG: hypothetical protein ACFBWO_09095 [Paracoccaceae bacterium]